MYQIIKSDYLNISAVSLPLSNVKKLPKDLNEFNRSHYIVSEGEQFNNVAKELENLTDEEINLSKPQFFFFLQELIENLNLTSFDLYSEITQAISSEKICENVLKDINKELLDATNLQINNPNNKNNLQKISYLLNLYFQGEEFFSQISKKHNLDYSKIEANLKKLNDLKPFYELLNDLNISKIKEVANNKFKNDYKNINDFEMDSNKISKLKIMMGDRKDLHQWVNAYNNKDEKKLEELKFLEFSKKDIDFVRKEISQLVIAYNNTKNNSFLGILMEIKNNIYYLANKYEERSKESINSSYNQLKSSNDEFNKNMHYSNEEKKELSYKNTKGEENIKEKIKDVILDHENISLSMKKIGQSFNDLLGIKNKEIEQVLEFTGSLNSVIIGNFSNSNDKLFVIFKDNRFEDMPNALWGAIVNKNDLEGKDLVFNEEFIEFIKNKTNKCSNFYSFSHLMNEISEPHIQEWIGEKFQIKDSTLLNKATLKMK